MTNPSHNIELEQRVKDLTSLTGLNLTYNFISDISFLKDLTSLTSLYISENLISDISFLKGFI